MKYLYKKEDHLTRFFGTNWNNKVSLIRWHTNDLNQNGFFFRDGYMEFRLGKWTLRYRNKK